jgi:Helicase associated domain.
VKYRRGELEPEREKQLKEIGVEFENTKDTRWQIGYQHMLDYCRRYNTARVPAAYKAEDGYALGEWLRTQIKLEASGMLKSDRKARLERLGVRWKQDTRPVSTVKRTQMEHVGASL